MEIVKAGRDEGLYCFFGVLGLTAVLLSVAFNKGIGNAPGPSHLKPGPRLRRGRR